VPEKLIINASRQLAWHRRLFSDLATLALWIGWICLWIPLMVKFRQILLHHLNLETAAIQVLDVVAPIPVTHSVIALMGTSALLILWALLPSRQVKYAHEVATTEDFADCFRISPASIESGRASRICVVTHDEQGNVVDIAPR
jgi:poly-beta-1,6-N-acetyl-D-glucosamine biosynthesis protein PgaD